MNGLFNKHYCKNVDRPRTFFDTLAMMFGIATHPKIAIVTVNTAPNIPTINPFLNSDWMHIAVSAESAYCIQLIF